VCLEIPGGAVILCATKRLPELTAIVFLNPAITVGIPPSIPFPADRGHALRALVRSRLECLGPVRAVDLARPLDLPVSDLEQALAVLEQESFTVRGRFDPDLAGEQWCER